MFLLAAAIAICAISVIVMGSLTGEKQPSGGGGSAGGAAEKAAQDEKKRREEKEREEARKRKARRDMEGFYNAIDNTRKKAEEVAKEPKKAGKSKPGKEKVENMGALPISAKSAGEKQIKATPKVAPSPARTMSKPTVSVSTKR